RRAVRPSRAQARPSERAARFFVSVEGILKSYRSRRWSASAAAGAFLAMRQRLAAIVAAPISIRHFQAREALGA
ncbi:MAG TPA: hypothetical protein VK459_16045, partial [Polyangiaceae bacterium]|nr:hypothetical protein [Polyangiaceae bacterium]